MRSELRGIKNQLAKTGKPTKPQTAYLLDALTRNEDGESLEEAFDNAIMPMSGRGKQSVAFQAAQKSRNMKLLRAFSLLEGSDWWRCNELARLSANMRRAMKSGPANPTNEVESLILRAINTGVPMPDKWRGFYDALKPFLADESKACDNALKD